MIAISTEIYRCSAKELGLSPDSVSPAAYDVIKKLQESGYDAYVVGGCVRDLLLDYRPKDYDIVTSAHPDEILRCFSKKCRIIGRRFKIVHVGFGRKAIEVSTFRAVSDDSVNHARVTGQDGLIIRDNQYGTLEEDIMRRDFTVNSMYYDPFAASVVCHPHSLKHIQQRRLCFIGDARERCREDPVRMIRALRLSAKTNLRIESDIKQCIHAYGELLKKISPARLFDENIKWMHGGSAYASWGLLKEYRLHKILFPAVYDYLKHDKGGKKHQLIKNLFRNTDQRIAKNKPVTPAFTILTMLWPAIALKQEDNIVQGKNPRDALYDAYQEVMQQQQACTAIPQRIIKASSEICLLQMQLVSRNRKKIHEALNHPRFRAAYDLLCFRAEVGQGDAERAKWWTKIQEVSEQDQTRMINEYAPSSRLFKRISRRTYHQKEE